MNCYGSFRFISFRLNFYLLSEKPSKFTIEVIYMIKEIVKTVMDEELL